MTSYEKQEIQTLPEKYRPIGAWGYFGYTLLFAIPVVGFIFLIVFACSDGNINRRSFARSYFCAFIIAAVFMAILFVLGLGTEIIDAVKEAIQSIGQ